MRLSLELGRHTSEELDRRLRDMAQARLSPSARAHIWASALLGTPFEYESSLPALSSDTLRVRLASFDCITFVYSVIALASAASFDQYLMRLREIRYKTTEVANGAKQLELLDFACEALLFNCLDNGILRDVTESIVGENERETYAVSLRPLRRPKKHDPGEQWVYPRYEGRQLNTSVIPVARLASLDLGAIEDGDVVLFSRGLLTAGGQPAPLFVAHAGFAARFGATLGLIHATGNYTTAGHDTGTRTYLDGQKLCEVLGVSALCEYMGDHSMMKIGDHTYYGYWADKRRSIADYALSNFRGVKVLRICEHGAKEGPEALLRLGHRG